jgi:hypothetical protein
VKSTREEKAGGKEVISPPLKKIQQCLRRGGEAEEIRQERAEERK